MKKFRLFSGILCGVLLCSLVFPGCGQEDSSHSGSASQNTETMQQTESDVTDSSTAETTVGSSEPVDSDRKLNIKDGLQTVLVMGIDRATTPDLLGDSYLAESYGYLNNQQTDFMMLLVVDSENKICDAIHLNRDSIATFDRLGIGNKPAGKVTEQITLAHTYGDGGDASYRNSCNAVSNLLLGVPVDHYVALTLDGFIVFNDAAGGVEVKIPLDMTVDDPAFIEGETVRLLGSPAMLFVRARGEVGDGSNLSRMERQRSYLSALHPVLLEDIRKNPKFIIETLASLVPYMSTDLTIAELTDLCMVLKDCTLNPFTTIDGEDVTNVYKEYHVYPESVESVVQKIFCK